MKDKSSYNNRQFGSYSRNLLIWTALSYHPLINPRVNPADILPVNGIPKLVIANEEVVAAAWASTLPVLIPGICIVRFATVARAPSDTVLSLFQFMFAICWLWRYANPAKNKPTITATIFNYFLQSIPIRTPTKKPPPIVAAVGAKLSMLITRCISLGVQLSTLCNDYFHISLALQSSSL